MNTEPKLNLAELERLAEAYLDCRLTRLEEKELELLLADTTLDSPLLSEARLSMGIEFSMAADEARQKADVQKRLASSAATAMRRRVIRICSVAAGLILLLGIGWGVMRQSTTSNLGIEVVVDGRSLSGEKAEAYASRMQAEHMEMMYAMLAEAEQNMAANMRLIDELIPSN